MEKTGNFFNDMDYRTSIESCICYHDKFGSATFFTDVYMSECVMNSCMRMGATSPYVQKINCLGFKIEQIGMPNLCIEEEEYGDQEY